MNCCFMCTPFKPIDSARSEVSASMAEYLEKEKLCQELCKNITDSVESTEKTISTLNVPNITLLPDINTDDIEGILHQISELLTPRSCETSQKTDVEDDSRSVEEILKEAESLVRASTPYFEKLSSGSSNSWTPLPKLSLPSTQKKNKTEKSKHALKTLEVRDLIINSIEDVRPRSPLPPEKKSIEEKCPDRPQNIESKPVGNEYTEERPNEVEIVCEISKEVTPQESLEVINKVGTNDSEEPEKFEKLSLSDLVNQNVNTTFTLSKPSYPNMPPVPKPDNDSGVDNQISDADVGKLQKVYEDKLFDLQKQIALLNSRIAEYQRQETENTSENRLALLEEENKSQHHLITGYQKENHRLTSDFSAAKDIWKETEVKLVDQIRQLDKQLKSTIDFNNNELRSLRDKLKEAQDTVVTLEFQISKLKAEKLELETSNEELTVDVTRLRCEVEEYKKEMQEWGRKERDRINTLESNAILQGKLSQANTEVTRKQTEIVRLNGEVGKLRGELERIRLGSVINHPSETLSITVSQLQSALNMERENVKEILKEKDSVSKENLDLKRQVKELESIVKRRVKSGNSLPFGFESSFPSQDFKQREAVEQKNKELENHLAALESQQVLNQDAIKGMEAKLQQRRIEHEEELKRLQEENSSLKQALEDQVPKSARRQNSASSNAVSVREDAHLLATIRGLKMELTGRDKEIIRLNKELEDSKRTNRRLQKEREKALNPTTKSRGTNNKDMDKVLPLSLDSGCPGKNYNPLLFEEDQEAVLFLRAENKTLREEIKRLEQDLISLHNKRIQDLSDLQQEHDSAMAQLLREHASKHSSSTVAHLQGQLYTQQMVINHLKQQIKELEERVEEIPVLKAERDQLESTLIEANKKIARLHDLASPESVQYSGLLEKLEFLERRHQVREQKLQSIVRDLISRQSQASGLCTSTCRDKLMNKNREICYYRAEMDRILDTLAEFKWGM